MGGSACRVVVTTCLAVVWAAGCEESSEPGSSDGGTAGAATSGSGGAAGIGNTGGQGGGAGGSGAGQGGTGVGGQGGALPPGCDLAVELSYAATSKPSGVVIAAGSEPMLCWLVPPGGQLPGPDGWDVWVGRDDAPSGEPTDAEWVVMRGVPPSETRVRYGDCPPGAMACWPAKQLRPGGHSLSIWDGTRVGGLGATVSFDVE